MHGSRESATKKAARIWGECFLLVRREVRAQGVTGELPYLDATIAGRRGVAAPHQIHTLAGKFAAAGLPRETAKAALAHSMEQIVDLAYGERQGSGTAA